MILIHPNNGIGVHDDLRQLRDQLAQIYDYMSSYEPPIPKPPILDSSTDDVSDNVGHTGITANQGLSGLRALKDSVKRDLEVLEKFLADPKCIYLPALSTNAPYLISVWNEVLSAPQPVLTIGKTFPDQEDTPRTEKALSKSQGAKVDVVADDGRMWIRVNTIKNSRILAEFREIDSYLTDSDEDDETSNAVSDLTPTLAQTKFDNSVLRMGRSLLSAASISSKQQLALLDEPDVTYEPIKVVMRLTRLDPSPKDESKHDPRIARTIAELKEMGIDVQLGEIEAPPPRPRLRNSTLLPTTRVNLDLSILIALISDLTHMPLPISVEEAESRFIPPASYLEWKRKRTEEILKDQSRTGKRDKGRIPDIRKHSRALTDQALQERERGMIQEIQERLLSTIALPSNSATSIADIEFWTTQEAHDRCLRIVAKIGGPREKKRAQALFSSQGEQDFWEGSRYSVGNIPITPIHIFPSDSRQASDSKSETLPPLFPLLEKTCVHILSQEIIPDPRSVSSNLGATFSSLADLSTAPPADGDTGNGNSTLGESDSEIRRAAVTKANPKLTAHTVQSMLEGAKRGWTTLTANKGSVKVMLREIKALNGPLLGGVPPGALASGGDEVEEAILEDAAIWVVDPRSLAEGMRSDFTP